jgi:peptide/nickel transport system permease protein
LQRALLSLPTLFFISILVFVGIRVLMPASVVDTIIGEYGRNDPEYRHIIEKQLGLDASIPRQYTTYMGHLLTGDLGRSLHSGRSVSSELKRRMPISFELGLFGQVTAILWAIPLGLFAAVHQDKWPDYGLRSFAILVNSLPNFWIAVMIITFGSIWFHWAPPIKFSTLTQDPIQHLKIMATPALIIGLTPSGGLIRLVRTQMLEVLRQDYVRTAHAKGLSRNSVFYKHALRNALIPVVTVIGVGLPNLVAGTVIFEQIFVIPGMGRYLVDAINQLDYPVIQGLVLLFAVLLSFATILVDVSYTLLDPRIRFG